MIVIHQKRLIKRLPDKYSVIDNITDYFEDFDHIRLSKTERINLNMALFYNEIDWFIRRLELNEPIVYEHIKNAKPVSVSCVKQFSGEEIYHLKFSNNIDVICPFSIYRISPVKFQKKLANSLSRQNNSISSKQLTLFDL